MVVRIKVLYSQVLEGFTGFLFEGYFVSALLPAYFFVLELLRRIDIGPEPPAIENLPFLEVTDVKDIFLIFHKVSELKVKPLQMSPGIGVNPHKEIVLKLSYLS